MTDETNKPKTSTKKTGNRKQTSGKAVSKAKSANETSEGVQQDEQQVVLMMPDLTEEHKAQPKDEVDIAPYVSNVDGSVYAISGLPEEFIATLFAWVSRSPKSFKEHLKIALKDQDIKGTLDAFKKLDDKAKAFHEKWTVGYGHSCYDELTDVLTRTGWKRWSDVKDTDELASVDPDTMEIEYQQPLRLIAEPYCGPMYHVNRNRVNMMVTPNHKNFAWPRHKIEGFETRKYQLIKAEDLKGKCYKIKLGGLLWEGDQIDELYGYPVEALLQFYGFFIGDGYIDPRMNHAVSFHLHKQRKIDYLYQLCDELNLCIERYKNNKFYVTSTRNKESIGKLMSSCYDENRVKQIPSELFGLHSDLLLNLYDGLLNSDGSVGRTGEVYDTSSLKLVDQIQHLILLLGWTSSVTLLHPSQNENHKDCYRIFINKKLLDSMINKVQYDLMDEWVDYNGMVYCAELENHNTLIVRRDGRIHVSGNSVAEHAVAHVGIENVSRLASAELELSNGFLSITEYSQRYQKPTRGGWHNPFSAISVGQPLDKPSMHERLEEFYEKAFNAFEQLIEGVFIHLCRKESIEPYPERNTNNADPKQFTKEITTKRSALMKLAFEDARYVLPLAMHTQLGMTANGRAWRDALAVLGNSDHAESVKLADDLREEITKVLPVLLKYATPSQYQINSKKRMKKATEIDTKMMKQENFIAKLHEVKDESAVIDNLVAALGLEYTNLPFESGHALASRYMTNEGKRKIIQDLIFEMQHFDTAPEVFKHVRYNATFLVSEANWHQLLRHNRMTDFTFGEATPHFGITVPPRIVEAGLTHIVKDIAQDSKDLYNKLVGQGFEQEAQYVVLNAHKRPIYASFSLWEAYHLINLRTSDEAQWDIRKTFEELFKQLYTVHPLLISGAKRRP